MRIGLIQTRGIGDIVIAAPIAMYFIRQGHEVFWPIDSEFIEPFQFALPLINFCPVEKSMTGTNTASYFIEYPKKVLEELNCTQTHILYSHLTGYEFAHANFTKFLSFDRYKYAVTGVPFFEKWNLKLNRNTVRERELFNLLNLEPSEPYIVVHDVGSNFRAELLNSIDYRQERIIRITNLTDNFFDWLGVLENCREAHLIDSLYSNVVEQINFKIEKKFYPRSGVEFTPVFKTDWKYSL